MTGFRVAVTCLLALVLAAGVGAARVRADETLEASAIVLDLTAARTTSSALARHLTRVLRDARPHLTAWRAIDSHDVTLSELARLHDCDAIDAACLANITLPLDVDRIVDSAAGDAPNGLASLTLPALDQQNAYAAPAPATHEPIVIRRRVAASAIRLDMDEYLDELALAQRAGRIVVRTPVANARVRIDGRPVHTVAMATVSAGSHYVEVEARGHVPFRQTVMVQPGQDLTIDASMPAAQPPRRRVRPLEGAGWGLAAGGITFLGLALYSTLRVDEIESDSEYMAYRMATISGADACDAAEMGIDPSGRAYNVGRIRRLCEETSVLDALGIVFLAGGVASLGSGIFLLTHDLQEREQERRTAADEGLLSFKPKVTPREARVTATLSF